MYKSFKKLALGCELLLGGGKENALAYIEKPLTIVIISVTHLVSVLVTVSSTLIYYIFACKARSLPIG